MKNAPHEIKEMAREVAKITLRPYLHMYPLDEIVEGAMQGKWRKDECALFKKTLVNKIHRECKLLPYKHVPVAVIAYWLGISIATVRYQEAKYRARRLKLAKKRYQRKKGDPIQRATE